MFGIARDDRSYDGRRRDLEIVHLIASKLDIGMSSHKRLSQPKIVYFAPAVTTHFATRKPARNRILIFARVPELGLVKSRLAKELGPERTLEIYQAMLDDVLDRTGDSGEETEVEVLWTGSDEVEPSRLRQQFGKRYLSMQAGLTLGDRLAVAFSERFFFHATEKVIAIGTDDPTLSRQDIDVAFGLLDSCEWVVGPAYDGGYYLIGCRGPSFDSSVFRDLEWGTDTVFARTATLIRDLGATMAVLPLRRDLDTMSDLDLFSADPRSQELKTGALVRSWSFA